MPLTQQLFELGYELLKEAIGSGGSAVVHKAKVIRDDPEGPGIGTVVAIKQYLPGILQIPDQVRRIEQEGELGQQLRHPNVVKTYKLHSPNLAVDDDTYFLILEWVEGETLDRWYSRHSEPPAWELIRGVCLDLVRGIGELHGRGIMHRDIKPENVMVRSSGGALLMDIGVAEPTADTEHSMGTSMRDFLGSTRYASPQFILGNSEFQAADDIYSLGATFHLLFAGSQIFSEVVRKPVIPIIAVQGPPRIDSLRENVPASMRVLLQACLSHDRERRPSLDDLQDALENPEESKFISRELERQAAEAKSYDILDIQDKGASFFADLAGDFPKVGENYKVVRRGKRIFVPSYNREVVAEEWVAEAELKHVTSNLGYFVVVETKWEETHASPFASSLAFGSRGQWVEREKRKLVVSPGDVVLRRSDHEF